MAGLVALFVTKFSCEDQGADPGQSFPMKQVTDMNTMS